MPETANDASRDDIYFFGPPGPGERFISYLSPERVYGVQVRFVIKVVSGDHAKHIDAVQAKAIMDALRWHRDHRQRQDQQEQTRQHQDARQPDTPRK